MWEQLTKSLEFGKLGEAGVYFIFGLVMLFLGRMAWNLITSYNSNKEIGTEDNVSAGIAEFGFLIALAIIILASFKGGRGTTPLYIDLMVTFIYAVLGLVALAIGKISLDLFTPFDLDAEISRDKNPSAAWLQAGFYIAISFILYGVL